MTIAYDDHSTVLINSLEDFVRYHEVRAITSVAAHLSWTFLVRFQDRLVVEKQQIDVSIVAEKSIPVISDELGHHVFVGSQPKGFFFFRISHTARTWGADIEALLTGHIENLIKKIHPLKTFIREKSGWIGFGVGLVLLLCSMAGCLYTTQAILDSQLQQAKASTTPAAKLDYVVHLLATGTWPRFFFYVFCFLIIALAVSIFLGIWAGSAADNEEPSFLLLSKQAEKHRTKQFAKTKKSWFSFVLSLLTSISAGIIGRILFELFLRKWF